MAVMNTPGAITLGLSVGLTMGLVLVGHGAMQAAAQAKRPQPVAPAVPQPPQHLPLGAQWCLGSAAAVGTQPPLLSQPLCIALEVARTPQQQSFGLQRRARLAPLRGMWFPYSTPTPVRFWMHLTPEPLDMIFVGDGRVVDVVAQAKPCMRLPCRSYGPGVPVDGVIELAAGEAARLGIGRGTPVRITTLNPQQPASGL